MKKLVTILLCGLLILNGLFLFSACGKKTDVTIFSSMEDFRNEKLVEMLKEEFPDMKIDLTYFPSGDNAAKVEAEGTKIAADIVLDIDYGYMNKLKANFADLTDIIALTEFLDEIIPDDNTYFPVAKQSVGIIVNETALNGKAVPASYDDLTDPIYKGLISMPSPKSSGTGYSFVKGMVELKGEDNAFAFFKEFQKNVKAFTTSGSGPVNNLAIGEAAIGVGMIFQAVQKINEGVNLTILDLPGGTPYNQSGGAIIKGRENKENVKKVAAFITAVFLRYDNIYFIPESLFKKADKPEIENFPVVNNMNMNGFSQIKKQHLLERWANEIA